MNEETMKYKTYTITDSKLKWFLNFWTELVRAADNLHINGLSSSAVNDEIGSANMITTMFYMQDKDLVNKYFEIEEHEVEEIEKTEEVEEVEVIEEVEDDV